MKDTLLEDIQDHPGTWIEDVSRRLEWNRQTVSKYADTLEGEDQIRIERKGNMKTLWPKGEEE